MHATEEPSQRPAQAQRDRLTRHAASETIKRHLKQVQVIGYVEHEQKAEQAGADNGENMTPKDHGHGYNKAMAEQELQNDSTLYRSGFEDFCLCICHTWLLSAMGRSD